MANQFKIGDTIIMPGKVRCSGNGGCEATVRGLHDGYIDTDKCSGNGSTHYLNPREVAKCSKSIKRGRPAKEKVPEFVVIYDTTCGDPAELFTSKADLVKWLKEARDDKKIIFNSIRAFPLKGELKIKLRISLTEKKA